MRQYAILIGLSENLDLGDDAQRDRRERQHAIVDLIFSLGPAWQGSQSSILLQAEASSDEIIRRVSPLVTHADFISVMEIDAKSITTIGLNPDEQGMDALYPDIEKWGVAPSGDIYPQE